MTSSTTPVAPATATRPRLAVLDGIRGIAIILVILSHMWVVYPVNSDFTWGPLPAIFGSGNYAVTIFFVVGAYLATSGMLREVDRTGALRPGVGFVRRWIRISGHVYPLVIAVLVLAAIDSNMEAYKLNNTRESAWRIITYTWNGYVARNPFDARPDLGHLWYVCTDIWGIALIFVMVFLLGRHRRFLLAALAVTALMIYIYRGHVYTTEGEAQALIRITTRGDGLLWGAMAAVAAPWLQRYRDNAARISAAALVLMVGLMFVVYQAPRDPTKIYSSLPAYYGLGGELLNIATAVFVVFAAMAAPLPVVRRVIGNRFLLTAGRYSLVLYLWHYPIFWYLSRNTPEWSSGVRLLVGLLATLIIGVISQRLIEQPLQRWLGGPFWRRFDQGLVKGVASAATSRFAAWRGGRASEAEPDSGLRPGENEIAPQPRDTFDGAELLETDEALEVESDSPTAERVAMSSSDSDGEPPATR